MSNGLQSGMECSQFEVLLADALDGALTAQIRPRFEEHGRNCKVCGPMLAEAREGMLLLRALPEVDPPKNMVHNILAATSMAEARAQADGAPSETGHQSWLERLVHGSAKGRAGRPSWVALHSRFVTSFCMAFFSLSLTLAMAGVRISSLAKIDWHPTAVKKSVVLEYTQLEARVQRYYDNMRLVVELEARVRGLKRAAEPAPENNNRNKPEQQNRNSTPDTSGHPREHEDYSQDNNEAPVQANLMILRSEGARQI
ncbi:MAG: anti-sigma factor family protein [Candidatus Angelobacter sp.]